MFVASGNVVPGAYVAPPTLNPNQPKNRIAAPTETKGKECGVVVSLGKISRLFNVITDMIAAIPQVA